MLMEKCVGLVVLSVSYVIDAILPSLKEDRALFEGRLRELEKHLQEKEVPIDANATCRRVYSCFAFRSNCMPQRK